ncbi:MAG: hypothetical protein HRU19_27970 [Pseudobacteriovorax sp.]|nr:hypothetical protein [Pseudobacteriovorax sp.]
MLNWMLTVAMCFIISCGNGGAHESELSNSQNLSSLPGDHGEYYVCESSDPGVKSSFVKLEGKYGVLISNNGAQYFFESQVAKFGTSDFVYYDQPNQVQHVLNTEQLVYASYKFSDLTTAFAQGSYEKHQVVVP